MQLHSSYKQKLTSNNKYTLIVSPEENIPDYN